MHNHAKVDCIYLLPILLYIHINIILITAERTCYERGNFKINGAYHKNRDLLLSTLASNVTVHGFFYNATIGQYPDKVYARAVCRGDSSPKDCANCISLAANDILSGCKNQKQAFAWKEIAGSPCLVRYANYSVFGILEVTPMVKINNAGNITLTQFDQTWDHLIDRMVLKASTKKFVTEIANLTSFRQIYALMQCTPDMSQRNCNYCLLLSVNEYQNCCNGKPGGSVMRPSCIFRWEFYLFFNATTDAPSLSPPIAHGVPPRQTDTTAKLESGTWIGIGIAILGAKILVLSGFFLWRIWRRNKEKKARRRAIQLLFLADDSSHNILQGEKHVESQEFPVFPLGQILEATQHFSNENKLGEGGFGPVYKGKLADGKEIAVKRLARTSGQGLQEFKNEVTLIAKLQHKNLVRLLGCCLEGNELLLIYEYMPNKSLDVHLFDSIRSIQLDWKKRISIINGIVRGLLYLHEDSRLKIVHRDLKTSNILLDPEMNPKISDFGMARIFGGNQIEANTNRVVGTYGYMAPEYAMEGTFSVKSDVFSFGVLLLEIISGRKSTGFHLSEHGCSLLTYASKLWCEGRALELMDPVLVQSCVPVELTKFIHIGLLCVQEDPVHRPTMSSVVFMLVSDNITLPKPTQPAFSVVRVVQSDQSSSDGKGCSINEVTISNVTPR